MQNPSYSCHFYILSYSINGHLTFHAISLFEPVQLYLIVFFFCNAIWFGCKSRWWPTINGVQMAYRSTAASILIFTHFKIAHQALPEINYANKNWATDEMELTPHTKTTKNYAEYKLSVWFIRCIRCCRGAVICVFAMSSTTESTTGEGVIEQPEWWSPY